MNTLPLTIAYSSMYIQYRIRIGFYGAIVIDYDYEGRIYGTTRWRRCCNRCDRDFLIHCAVTLASSSAFLHSLHSCTKKEKGKQRNGIFEDFKLLI